MKTILLIYPTFILITIIYRAPDLLNESLQLLMDPMDINLLSSVERVIYNAMLYPLIKHFLYDDNHN